MRFQSGPSFCGPAAVVNALRALGLKVREEQAAQYAGTTPGLGTGEFGIRQALDRFGCKTTELSERKYAKAEEALFNHLKHGPSIILAEGGDHWIAVIGTLGDRIIIFDSQNRAFNRKENGVHVLERGEQLRRFWLPFENKRYAILITKDE